MKIKRVLAKYSWAFLLITILVVFDLAYFWGFSLDQPIIDSDWGPFPVFRISGIVNYLQTYQIYNIPMQNIVGNGSLNFLSPFYLLEGLFTILSGNSAFSQILFLFLVSIFSALGMTFLFNYFVKGKIWGIMSGLIYSFTPLLIINLIAGGNPGGFWWYMIIPWYILISLKTIDKPSVKQYIYLALVTFLVLFTTNQLLFLTILFFSIPMFLAKLLSSRPAKLSSFLYLIFVSLGLFFMLYLFSLPSISVVTSDAYSLTTTANVAAYIRSLATPSQMIFLNTPNFGYMLFSKPFLLAPVNNDFLVLDSVVDIFLVVVLFHFRKMVPEEFYFVILSIFLFPFLILTILILPSGEFIVKHFPYVYAIFPEYFLVPVTVSLTMIITLSFKLSVGLIANNDKYPALKSTDRYRTKKELPIQLKVDKDRFHLYFSIRKSLVGMILILILATSIAPLIISDTSSGGYIHVVNKLQPVTYVPDSVISAAQELRLLRTRYNMTNARDLWEPMNAGSPLGTGIIYEDPNALIYPAENVLSFSNGSSLQNSYVFLYYSLIDLIQNNNTDFGNLLQQLGVGFVVVIKNFSFNRPYEAITGGSYNGSLLVDSSTDTLVGNPLQLISILSNQSSLTMVASSNNYTIFFNNEYMGQLFGYNRILNPIDPISAYNFTQLESMPLWNSSLPIAESMVGQNSNSYLNSVYSLQYNNLKYINNFSGMQLLSPDFLVKHLGYYSGQLGTQYHRVPLDEAVAINNGRIAESPLISNFAGYSGNYLNFSGATSIVLSSNFTNQIENRIQKNFTVNVWFNTTKIPKEVNGSYGYEEIFGNGRGFDLGEVSSPLAYLDAALHYNNSGADFYHRILPNTWYMATMIYNGTVLSFYLNGTLVGRQNVSDIYWGTNNFVIGRDAFHANDYWTGTISDLAVSNEIINASRVNSLYKMGPAQMHSSIPGSLMFFPLTRETIKSATVSVNVPTDIKQEVIGYSGSIEVNSIFAKSNGIGTLILNLSGSSPYVLNISGSGYLYYLIGTGNTTFDRLQQFLKPIKIDSQFVPGVSYSIDLASKWEFLTNTYTSLLSANVSSKAYPSINGLSLIYIQNIHEMVLLHYKGISPQIYQVFGLGGYLILAVAFGVLSPYLVDKLKRRNREK